MKTKISAAVAVESIAKMRIATTTIKNNVEEEEEWKEKTMKITFQHVL